MGLNINELPERGIDRDPKIIDMPVVPPPRQSITVTLKIVTFLFVVVALTALAINSHHLEPGQSTAASDTPPTAASTTLPSAIAPTDRATTGAAPNPPAPPPAGGSQ